MAAPRRVPSGNGTPSLSLVLNNTFPSWQRGERGRYISSSTSFVGSSTTFSKVLPTTLYTGPDCVSGGGASVLKSTSVFSGRLSARFIMALRSSLAVMPASCVHSSRQVFHEARPASHSHTWRTVMPAAPTINGSDLAPALNRARLG